METKSTNIYQGSWPVIYIILIHRLSPEDRNTTAFRPYLPPWLSGLVISELQCSESLVGLFGRAWVHLPDWYSRAWESGPHPWAVRRTFGVTKRKGKLKTCDGNISCIPRTCNAINFEFLHSARGVIANVITHTGFFVNQFRGFWVMTPGNLAITAYHSVALRCLHCSKSDPFRDGLSSVGWD